MSRFQEEYARMRPFEKLTLIPVILVVFSAPWGIYSNFMPDPQAHYWLFRAAIGTSILITLVGIASWIIRPEQVARKNRAKTGLAVFFGPLLLLPFTYMSFVYALPVGYTKLVGERHESVISVGLDRVYRDRAYRRMRGKRWFCRYKLPSSEAGGIFIFDDICLSREEYEGLEATMKLVGLKSSLGFWVDEVVRPSD